MYVNDLLFNAISGLILSSILLIVLIISLSYYLKMKLLPSLYMTCMWSFYLLWVLSFSIGLLISVPLLVKGLIFLLGCYALIPAGYMGLSSVELLLRNKIHPIKLIIFTILATLLTFSPFYESIWSTLRTSPIMLALNFRNILGNFESTLLFEIIIRLFFSFNWIQFGYLMFIRYKEILKAYKNDAKILQISLIFLGLLSPGFFWFIHVPFILGIVFICLGIGTLLLIVLRIINPVLLHFIPIRLIRLTVMEVNSGKSIYSYKWNTKKDLVNEDLFATMLKGVNSILNESIRSGSIQEIDLDEGVLIFNEIQKTGFVTFLIAERPSNVLKKSLKIFNKKFYNSYHEYLKVYWDRDNFKHAGELVKEVFSFLPDFLGSDF